MMNRPSAAFPNFGQLQVAQQPNANQWQPFGSPQATQSHTNHAQQQQQQQQQQQTSNLLPNSGFNLPQPQQLQISNPWQTSLQSQQIVTPANPTLYTYNELEQKNPSLKQEIDTIYFNFKVTMREGLDTISKSQGSVPSQLKTSLKSVSLGIFKLENTLNQLRKDSELYRDMSKELHRDVQVYGRMGVQQIKLRGGAINSSPYSISEELPIYFYHKTIQSLEKRYEACNNEIQQISNQIAILTENSSSSSTLNNKITSADLIVKQIQYQYAAFIRLAAAIADIHTDVEMLKSKFLSLFYRSRRRIGNASFSIGEDAEHGAATLIDPFQAADREEELKVRRLEQKIKSEIQLANSYESHRNQPLSTAQVTTTPGMFSNTFQSQTVHTGFGTPSAVGISAPGSIGGGSGNQAAHNTFGATPGSRGGFHTGAGVQGGYGGLATSAQPTSANVFPLTASSASTGFGGFGSGGLGGLGGGANPFGVFSSIGGNSSATQLGNGPGFNTGANTVTATPAFGGFGSSPSSAVPGGFFGAQPQSGGFGGGAFGSVGFKQSAVIAGLDLSSSGYGGSSQNSKGKGKKK